MAQLQVPAVEPIDALSKLADDSSGSLSADVLDRARTLLRTLRTLDAPAPFIFPTEIGGIQFEWHGGQFELDLEVLPGTQMVSVMFQDGNVHKEGEVRDDKELQTLIAWLRQ
jgi:hypothetical protein